MSISLLTSLLPDCHTGSSYKVKGRNRFRPAVPCRSGFLLCPAEFRVDVADVRLSINGGVAGIRKDPTASFDAVGQPRHPFHVAILEPKSQRGHHA